MVSKKNAYESILDKVIFLSAFATAFGELLFGDGDAIFYPLAVSQQDT